MLVLFEKAGEEFRRPFFCSNAHCCGKISIKYISIGGDYGEHT